MTPKVSIITPCYNSSEFIEETIKSVLAQTFQDWEWLITDDKSSDNTAEIIKKYNDSNKMALQEMHGTKALKGLREDILLFWIVMIIGNLYFWNE